MIQQIIEIPLESVRTGECNTGDDACIICGKKIKGEPKKFVQLLTNGNLISSDQPFDNSQGFFPVGTECAKRLVIKFAF